MDSTVTTSTEESVWGGGNRPLGASYGKLMMWFFIVSDALTFSGFLASYGFSRFKFIETWPIADEVFTHVPAVDAGHKMMKNKAIIYMFLTIIGGAIFVGSQAWEWATFIKGDYGAIETRGGRILQFVKADSGERAALSDFAKTLPSERVDHESRNGVWFYQGEALPSYSVNEVVEGLKSNPNILIRTETINAEGEKTLLTREESLTKIKDAKLVVEGANLIRNEYGSRLFADFFFFITGFHGFHVFSGVIINIIIFFNIILGTYERRGHYEMVEKVGLYWHFVDLVWVFVFTFFYLV
jgi:cytochrome c oxidase subunit 3